MVRKIFILAICLIFSSFIYSNNKYLINSIASEKGLSNSAVLTIFQDSNGLMWFGTYDGLNCYDSSNMEVFRSKSPYNEEFTFKSNIIQNISQADNECLWIKTFLGVARFSISEKCIKDIYPKSEYYSIYSNSNGDTWVINSSELLYYNTFHRKFISLGEIIPDANKINNSIVTENGELWIMYSGASDIISFNIPSFNTSNTSPSEINVRKDIIPLHSLAIDEYFVQADNTFSFIDADKNLYLYDVASNTKVFIRNISAIIQKYGKIKNIVSFDDDVILAFHLNGLVRLDFMSGYGEEAIDRSIRVFSMTKDRNTNIAWIGTDGQGVLMLYKNNSIASTLELSSLSPLLKRQVRSISTDRHGGLWIGTKGDGLIHLPDYEENWNRKTAVEIYSGSSRQSLSDYVPWEHDKRVFSINESRFHDGMWIGGTNSNLLYFYSFDLSKMIEVSGFDTKGKTIEIKGVYEEDENTLWVSATLLGLVRMELDIERSGSINVSRQEIKKITNDNRDTLSVFYSMISQGDSILWLGDRGKGLIMYNIKNDTYKVFSFQNTLGRPVDDILSICKYDDYKFYIGTSTGMVSMKYINDSVKNISYIGQENGLSNDMLHGILSDKNGFLWISSNRGLNKYNPMNGRIHTFYGNGIDISEFSDGAFYKCPYSGRLFFGGVNGLLYLSDNTAVQNTQFQDIVLRDFWIENERIFVPDYDLDGMKGYKIDVRKGYFRFKFIVPDFVGGENIEYSYMLEGHDTDWSLFSKDNDVTYSNVPSGKYIFKVRYKKDINENNGTILSVPIYITCPWYMSPYLYSVLLIIVLLLLGRWLYLYYPIERISIGLFNKRRSLDRGLSENTYNDVSHYGIRFGINNDEQYKFVEKLVSVIEANLNNESLGIPYLASELNMSTRQFYRKFNDVSADVSPNEFIKICRMEKAAELLKNSDMSIQDIISSVGINSRSYFYKEFTKRFGNTPKDFRKTTE